MGVVFVAFTLEDQKIDLLHEDPPLIWRIYEPEDTELYLSEIGAGKKPGFIARLFGEKEVAIPDPIPSFEYSEKERMEIDLDKSWDGISFCLKRILGDASPNIFNDGQNVGHVEVGYSPAMTFKSDQVKDLSKSLEGVTAEDILDQYKPDEMRSVYPKNLWKRDNNETREYLTENFSQLKRFLAEASNHHMGLCIVYT